MYIHTCTHACKGVLYYTTVTLLHTDLKSRKTISYFLKENI